MANHARLFARGWSLMAGGLPDRPARSCLRRRGLKESACAARSMLGNLLSEKCSTESDSSCVGAIRGRPPWLPDGVPHDASDGDGTCAASQLRRVRQGPTAMRPSRASSWACMTPRTASHPAILRATLRRKTTNAASHATRGVCLSGPDRARTDDLFHAMEALSQLSYRPICADDRRAKPAAGREA